MPTSSRRAASTSRRRRPTSGPGSYRWATGAAAGTATTSSTCEDRAPGQVDPDLQGLAEGDLVPTHPTGGFVAKVVDAPRALVLYLDSTIAKEQATAARDRKAGAAMPAGLQMAGSMGDFTMPDFRVSWAFVLEDAPGGGTHFVERFRVRTGEPNLPQRLGMPLMGYGVFVMTRKQMLGIKARAERRSAGG